MVEFNFVLQWWKVSLLFLRKRGVKLCENGNSLCLKYAPPTAFEKGFRIVSALWFANVTICVWGGLWILSSRLLVDMNEIFLRNFDILLIIELLRHNIWQLKIDKSFPALDFLSYFSRILYGFNRSIMSIVLLPHNTPYNVSTNWIFSETRFESFHADIALVRMKKKTWGWNSQSHENPSCLSFWVTWQVREKK